MHIGSDFFKWVQVIVAILRILGRVFGDDEDKKADDEVQGNHVHEVDRIVRGRGERVAK